MDNRKILRNPSEPSKAQLLAAIGEALLKIKCADRLTLDDMALVLGRSVESIPLYIAGETEMGVFAYKRAEAAWGERFTGIIQKSLEGGE